MPSARTLTAALRRMPALRALDLGSVRLPEEAAEELFRASSAAAAPQLRTLTLHMAGLSPAAARMLAASGWRLEELVLRFSSDLGAVGVAALVAAPTFALRRLCLVNCGLDAAALLAMANAPWPLGDLDLGMNPFKAVTAGPLAALSLHVRLRKLDLCFCFLSAASFKALVEAEWPALTHLVATRADVAFGGPHALGAAAFAGFPSLEELNLPEMALGEAGARLLASRRWSRLKELYLHGARLGDAGVAALARGAWPALERLGLCNTHLRAPLALKDARRWAPALKELVTDWDIDESVGEQSE